MNLCKGIEDPLELGSLKQSRKEVLILRSSRSTIVLRKKFFACQAVLESVVRAERNTSDRKKATGRIRLLFPLFISTQKRVKDTQFLMA